MEKKIISLLSIKENIELDFNEMQKKLMLEKDELEECIANLERKGIIFQNKRGKYRLVSRSSLKLGVVSMGKRSRPVVTIEGLGSFDLIYDRKNSVVNNSKVLVEVDTRIGTATVVRVLNDKKNTFIGQIIRSKSGLVIKSKGREDIPLTKDYPEGVNVLVDSSTGKIIDVIDTPYELKVKKMMVKSGMPITYSDAYLRELSNIPEVLSKKMISEAINDGAVDLSDKDLVTIDSEDTKDFDDGVCQSDNELIISIADVPGIILEGGVIEHDAMEKGTSCYPPGLVNHMFHKKISNGICSINPGVDRFADSIIFRITPDYSIVPYSFKRSIINSKGKLTYEKVNKYLEEGQVVEGYEKFTRMLDSLYETAMKIKKNMLEHGFLMFSSDEVKFLLENEKTLNMKNRHQGKAEELIEFLMLLYNMTKTDYMIKHNLPFIARNHDLPKTEKMRAWLNLLNQRGYIVEDVNDFSNEQIEKALRTYRGEIEQTVLDSIAIRGQAKAGYSACNKGHFALGLKAYATFTSPIRRLADYINERIFQDALKYGDDYARTKWEPRIEALAKICTDAEIRADKIERKAYDLKKLEYMANMPSGKVFENSIIAGVGSGYIKVLLPNNVYGKIFISKKNYELSSDGFSLINKVNGERLMVGDTLDVTLARVDMDKEEVILLRSSCKENVYEEKKGKKKVKKR